mmetsp:Transcript_3765/g.9132  ORF Transcript_3765/g.9132 Transcript_3765/m.9132 type:complete len:203 (-) Transcript_3765:5123-5731(-)
MASCHRSNCPSILPPAKTNRTSSVPFPPWSRPPVRRFPRANTRMRTGARSRATRPPTEPRTRREAHLRTSCGRCWGLSLNSWEQCTREAATANTRCMSQTCARIRPRTARGSAADVASSSLTTKISARRWCVGRTDRGPYRSQPRPRRNCPCSSRLGARMRRLRQVALSCRKSRATKPATCCGRTLRCYGSSSSSGGATRSG